MLCVGGEGARAVTLTPDVNEFVGYTVVNKLAGNRTSGAVGVHENASF